MPCLAAFVAVAAGAGAAATPTAAQVLADVDAHYQQTPEFKADFRQTYANNVVGKTSKSTGKLFVKKPGMRWDYEKPEKKYFISDGKTLWVFEPASRQLLVQSLSTSTLPVAVTFLVGQGSLAQTFAVAFDPGACTNTKDHCLKLTPNQTQAQFTTLWLAADTKTFEITESIVLETNGNTNHFWFTKRKNAVPKNTTFKVNVKTLPKGTTVIQGGNSGGGQGRTP